ncbi:MAG TPA: Xaa-Pro peptidase family protein, partial [Thermoanaerobaculia bacterium]|nr:Xaa-Pro peptidase family protein [Thermoanaerobaculia bacterium]
KAAGLDALVAVPSTSMAWLCGADPGRSERVMALVLRPKVPSAFVTPFFEEERVRCDAVVGRTAVWQEHEDPVRLLAALLTGARRIGIEGTTDFHTASRLRDATGARLVDAAGLFDGLRAVKSDAEKAILRDAAARMVAAIAATHARLAAGMTEREVGEVLSGELRRLGVRGGALVQFGASAALPHGGPGDARLEKGDVVLIDGGCRVRGYTSDITRTVAFGSASDEVRKVYAAVDAAQRAAFAAFRAGAIPEDVDRSARKVIEDAGYGAFFTHRLGHGLGMDGHEAPYLVQGNRVPLALGNVCTLEPGIYLPGRLGVRIEDDVFATADGCEALSVRPSGLVVLPA